MTRVRNLTHSPYDLPSLSGPVRLPAFGEVTGEFSGDYLDILAASLAVEILPDDPPAPAPEPGDTDSGHDDSPEAGSVNVDGADVNPAPASEPVTTTRRKG